MSQQNPEIKGYPITFNAVYNEKMSRLTTFFRGLLLIPHLIVLYFLEIAAGIIWVIAWFVILFTGNYPKGLYNFSVGFMRWMTRVGAYGFLLTDKYPPFSMD
jgi:hypothetical protein